LGLGLRLGVRYWVECRAISGTPSRALADAPADPSASRRKCVEFSWCSELQRASVSVRCGPLAYCVHRRRHTVPLPTQAAFAQGVAECKIQEAPHPVLLDRAFYRTRLRPALTQVASAPRHTVSATSFLSAFWGGGGQENKPRGRKHVSAQAQNQPPTTVKLWRWAATFAPAP